MTELIDTIETYVFEVMKEKLPQALVYHNFRHTVEVVHFCRELIAMEGTSDKDKEIILIAAWFHDLGHIYGAENHEKRSAELATSFLKSINYPQHKIDQIVATIKVTKFNVAPTNNKEEIIKDADTAHIATKKFKKKSELLRKELGLLGNSISKSKWLSINIEFLTNEHRFYTKYAIKNWDRSKNRNLIKLIDKKEKAKAKRKLAKEKILLKEAAKTNNPERGIQTMYRVTLRNHLKLSDIADTKANILLSVNAIIISLALANLIPKLDAPSNRHLLIPTLVLVLFSMASIIMSILATQPKVSGGEFSKDDLKSKRVNLLFFGNFFKMSYENYQSAIHKLLEDKVYIYDQLTKDLYYLGLVLNRKYKLLNITYIVFTVGIIASVVAFIIAFFNMELPEQIINATTLN